MVLDFTDFYTSARKKWIRKRKRLEKQRDSSGSITGLDDNAANN